MPFVMSFTGIHDTQLIRTVGIMYEYVLSQALYEVRRSEKLDLLYSVKYVCTKLSNIDLSVTTNNLNRKRD
jgi:hypothetical protein